MGRKPEGDQALTSAERQARAGAVRATLAQVGPQAERPGARTWPIVATGVAQIWMSSPDQI